jgi:hypothetical protein
VGEDEGEHQFDLHQAGFTGRGTESNGCVDGDYCEGLDSVHAGASGVGSVDCRDHQFGGTHGGRAQSR